MQLYSNVEPSVALACIMLHMLMDTTHGYDAFKPNILAVEKKITPSNYHTVD